MRGKKIRKCWRGGKERNIQLKKERQEEKRKETKEGERERKERESEEYEEGWQMFTLVT